MNTFKWLVRLRILGNLLLAGFILYAPQYFLEAFGFADPGSAALTGQQLWAQAFGIAYIFLTLAYVPSAIAPMRTPVSNFYVAFAPIIPIVLYFWLAFQMPWWGGFLWIALYELLFALALNMTLKREWLAELMTRP
jgi:hypothetical protein